MTDCSPVTSVPAPEAYIVLNGLPNSSGGASASPETFSGGGTRLTVRDFIGDCIGAACIFFLLFAGLFVGSVL